MSARDIEGELVDSLWFQLECRCAKCRRIFDTAEFDSVKEVQPQRWAVMVGQRAADEGWVPAENSADIFCPECASKQPRSPSP